MQLSIFPSFMMAPSFENDAQNHSPAAGLYPSYYNENKIIGKNISSREMSWKMKSALKAKIIVPAPAGYWVLQFLQGYSIPLDR